MGCCTSVPHTKNEKVPPVIQPDQERRRLSIGGDLTEPPPPRLPSKEVADGANEVPRSPADERGDGASHSNNALTSKISSEKSTNTTALEKKDFLFCAGSTKDIGRLSFNEKSMELLSQQEANNAWVGYTCRKGLKPESPNQDAWMVWKVSNDLAIYGVFDGHGPRGHVVADFVKDRLPEMVLKSINTDARWTSGKRKEVLSDAFKACHGEVQTKSRLGTMSAEHSGTTATLVVHEMEANQLTIAHVADSTCVMGSKSGDGAEGTALTRDHKPDLADERARIEKAGARVVFDGYANHRVYNKKGDAPGLNMSRSLGDIMAHTCGVSSVPEVSERKIRQTDDMLLLCSDGVWEFITPTEAYAIATIHGDRLDAAAEALAQSAWERWIREEKGEVVDDISVVLVKLHPTTSGDADPKARV